MMGVSPVTLDEVTSGYNIGWNISIKPEFDEETKDAFKEDGAPMTKGEKQWEDAVEQIKHYAEAPRVEALRQGTTLHKIIMQFKGRELTKMEEV